MRTSIACLADTVRMASVFAASVARHRPDATLLPFSLSTFLAEENPPTRVVLCPPGISVAGDVAFLRRIAARVLWPAPPARLAEAIDGIRSGDEAPTAAASRRRGRGPRGPALLLEGVVDAPRARAALAAARTRDWIVESAARVRLPPRVLALLEREGIRWSALAPVEVEGLYAAPELARAAKAWRGLLPTRTPVWVRIRDEKTPRRRGR